jgi:tetratricopeptide (TPR) repeat protein
LSWQLALPGSLKRCTTATLCTVYTRSLQMKPDQAEVHADVGATLIYLKRYQESLGASECAILLNPTFVRAHVNRATVLGILDQVEEALVAFDRAIELDPRYAMPGIIRASCSSSVSVMRRRRWRMGADWSVNPTTSSCKSA